MVQPFQSIVTIQNIDKKTKGQVGCLVGISPIGKNLRGNCHIYKEIDMRYLIVTHLLLICSLKLEAIVNILCIVFASTTNSLVETSYQMG